MIKNVLALISGAILLALGIMFSVLVLAVLAALGLAAWCFFWWKTRKLRRAMREKATGGHVIDGEVIVVEESALRVTNVLPVDPPER